MLAKMKDPPLSIRTIHLSVLDGEMTLIKKATMTSLVLKQVKVTLFPRSHTDALDAPKYVSTNTNAHNTPDTPNTSNACVFPKTTNIAPPENMTGKSYIEKQCTTERGPTDRELRLIALLETTTELLLVKFNDCRQYTTYKEVLSLAIVVLDRRKTVLPRMLMDVSGPSTCEADFVNATTAICDTNPRKPSPSGVATEHATLMFTNESISASNVVL